MIEHAAGDVAEATAGNAAALGQIDLLVNAQAAMISYVDDFKLMMWVTIAAMPLALILSGLALVPMLDDVGAVLRRLRKRGA